MRESKQASQQANVTEVDVVPFWRVYSSRHGKSVAANALLSGKEPAATMEVEVELESLLAGPPEERFEVSKEVRHLCFLQKGAERAA